LRADLDALAGAQHSLQGAVDGLGHRVQALGGDAAAVAARLATVEAVAAGLVEQDPTGAELAALCVAFEDACLRAQVMPSPTYPSLLIAPVSPCICPLDE
jgi:hypothetical protein